MRAALLRTVRSSSSRPLCLRRIAVTQWCHSTETRRPLSVAVSVGHGNPQQQEQLTDSTTTTYPTRSPEQERAALLEYDRMEHATTRLLSLTSSLMTPASVQELRITFQYWVGRRPRSLASKHEVGKSMQHAEALLDWMLHHADAQMLAHVLGANESPNAGLLNMLETYLMPFRSTYRTLEFAEGVLRQHNDPQVLRTALEKATRVMHKMQALHEDPSHPNLVPDYFSCNLFLDLWSKRCWFLRQFDNDSLEESFVENALDGVSTVSGCLKAMHDFVDIMKERNDYPSPDDAAYTVLISAWVHSRLPNAPAEAQALLQLVEEDPASTPNVVPYNAVLYAHASRAERVPSYATTAASLLEHMQQNPEKIPQPDVSSFASVLLAYANAGQADKAQQMLDQMEMDFETTQVRPNTICYNTVIDAWAKSGSPRAGSRAEALLQRMQHLWDTGTNPDVRPDKLSYSSVITTWARAPNEHAAERAESILFRSEELSAAEGQSHIQPDLISYNTVLDAWAKQSGRREHGLPNARPDETAVMRAESLLRRMQQLQQERDNVCSASSTEIQMQSIRPDTASYNNVMDAWFKSGSPNAERRAQELLDEMNREFNAGNAQVKPDNSTYNILLGCIARSNRQGSVKRAEEFLRKMEEDMGNHVKPNCISYNTVMDALVKSGQHGAAKRAEEFLHVMEQKYQEGNEDVRPNEITYNICLNGYAKSGDPDSAQRAEKILERMVELSEQSGRSDMRPSTWSFATVMDAYSRSGDTDAVDRAEAVFRKMDDCQYVTANTISFNTVINVLSKSKASDAAQRAESLLNRMQQLYESGNKAVRPDTVSFSSVINCWARSGQEGAAERAEAILNRMEELFRAGNSHMKPNAVSYSAVLNAWAKSGLPDAAERAMALLDRMETAAANNKKATKPNAYCYNAVTNAIARSPHGDKAQQAYAMLTRMTRAYKDGNEYARPNNVSYSTVLNACAHTTSNASNNSSSISTHVATAAEKDEAFRIARVTLLELMESDHCEPNLAIYINFLTACKHLMPWGKERDEMMGAVFEKCCQTGLVDYKVMRLIKTSVSPEVLQQLLRNQNEHHLPPTWTRNVEQKYRNQQPPIRNRGN